VQRAIDMDSSLFDRRKFIGKSGQLMAAVALSKTLSARAAQQPRGEMQPGWGAVDGVMEAVMARDSMAGASLAIAHQGHMVVERGYGLANVAQHHPVRLHTLFSIASVTKAITAAGIMHLVERGRLSLDARLVDVLGDLQMATRIADPRFKSITVRQVLYHAGGFPNRTKTAPRLEHELHMEEEADSESAVVTYRALMRQRLDFAPGSTHRYSNSGFLVLRLVLEHAAGESYEPYVHDKLLVPSGAGRMHLEKEGHYEPDEAHRYQAGGKHPARRLVANWLASAGDLVRFVTGLDGTGQCTLLSKSTLATMLSPPPPPIKPGRDGGHVGMGWDSVHQVPSGYRFSKNGGKPGIQAWLEHLEFGVDWALIFNTSPPEGRHTIGEVRGQMLKIFEGEVGAEPKGKAARGGQ
jgi:N-acyl-D-amino-acid deacylase